MNEAGVIRIDTSFSISQKELIDPAVIGTINVLESCKKASSIKRVVITSSTAAVVFNNNPVDPDVKIDETWFSDINICKEKEVRSRVRKSFHLLISQL